VSLCRWNGRSQHRLCPLIAQDPSYIDTGPSASRFHRIPLQTDSRPFSAVTGAGVSITWLPQPGKRIEHDFRTLKTNMKCALITGNHRPRRLLPWPEVPTRQKDKTKYTAEARSSSSTPKRRRPHLMMISHEPVGRFLLALPPNLARLPARWPRFSYSIRPHEIYNLACPEPVKVSFL